MGLRTTTKTTIRALAKRPRVLCLVLFTGMVLAPSRAHAWWYVEHAEIGSRGYIRACAAVETRVFAQDESPSGEIANRFEIACGNLTLRAKIYGQASALAGDRLDNPEDFLARGGDWKVSSQRHYFLLQLTDVHHFHPWSMQEWTQHHRIALERALAASNQRGIDAIDAFEGAFYRNAFADHFLQDSHAAGHMGFNRSASSIAATTAYHGVWNARGRLLQNREGEKWISYGDSHLNDPKNTEGRKRVIEACGNSAYAMIATFVFGERDTDQELQSWRELPYLIDASPIASLLEEETEETSTRYLRPLQAVSWPARVDAVVDLTFQALAPFGDAGSLTTATMAGFDTILPLLEVRGHLSFGVTNSLDVFEPRLASMLELRRPLGLSIDGLLQHSLTAGFLWEARTQRFTAWITPAYVLQMELGVSLVNLQVGPTYDFGADEFGYHAGVSFGRVFGVAGGGVR